MRTIIRIATCAFFSLLMCATAYAEDGYYKTIPISKDKPADLKGVPRTPIILPQEIMCTYSSDFLGIILPNEIGYLSVVIENENGMVLWTGVITHEQTSVMLPDIIGEATITCTTETGVEYSGTLEFE